MYVHPIRERFMKKKRKSEKEGCDFSFSYSPLLGKGLRSIIPCEIHVKEEMKSH